MCQTGQFYDANSSTGDLCKTAKLLKHLLQARVWPSVPEKLVGGVVVRNKKQRSPGLFKILAIMSFYFFLIYKEDVSLGPKCF